MESGPAIFAGTVFVLFGAALLLWTAARVGLRAPVAHGASPVASVAFSLLFGTASIVGGIWFLGYA